MSLTIDDVEIQAADQMKVLGITIDHCFRFEKQIAYLCTKAVRQLNVLQRLKGSLDYNSRLIIHKTFMMSNFDYCPFVWMFRTKSLLQLSKTSKRGRYGLF